MTAITSILIPQKVECCPFNDFWHFLVSFLDIDNDITINGGINAINTTIIAAMIE